MKTRLKKIWRTKEAFKRASPDRAAPGDASVLKKLAVPWAVREMDTHMVKVVRAHMIEGQGAAKYGCVEAR
jgi:hypothetical protein